MKRPVHSVKNKKGKERNQERGLQPARIDPCKEIRKIDPQIKYSLTPEFTVQFHPSKKKEEGKKKEQKDECKSKSEKQKEGLNPFI